MTMKYEVGNPGPGMEYTHECDGVKQVKQIRTLIIYYTNTAMKALSLWHLWSQEYELLYGSGVSMFSVNSVTDIL